LVAPTRAELKVTERFALSIRENAAPAPTMRIRAAIITSTSEKPEESRMRVTSRLSDS
jgi:hypothetical protein